MAKAKPLSKDIPPQTLIKTPVFTPKGKTSKRATPKY